MSRHEKFVISQKSILIRENKILILQLAKYPGKWDLPGGRIDPGEDGAASFAREISEEIGINSFDNLGLVDYRIWYTDDDNTPVCGIVKLIRNDSEEIKLSPEHTKMRWISEEEIDDYKYLWRFLGDIIRQGLEIYKNKQ